MVLAISNRLRSLFRSDSLRGRILQGGGVLTLGSFTENLLRFIRNMILARLLAPDAFGLMATIMATAATAEAFAEVGLTQSIIQNKRGADKEFLNIIWWLASLRAIALYMVAYFATPFISNFLNIHESTTIMRTAFTVILFRGFTSPNIYLLQKELRFTKWVLLTQGASCLGVLVAIVSAFYLRNVWALVLGYISEAFLTFAFSYIFYPLIPRFKFNSSHASEIIGFSKKVFGLPILMVIYYQADNFVIGKVLSIGTLGLYFLARNLAELPNTIFSKISPVLLPAFSLMQDDKVKLKKTLLKLTEIVATFGLPFFIFFIVFSRPILSLIYSPTYSTVSIPFSIFSIFVFLYLLSALIMNVVFATGDPDKHRTASMVRTISFLIVLYPATKYFGLIGAASTTLLSKSLCMAIQIHYLKKLININIPEYLASFTQGIKYSFIVLIPGILFNTFMSLRELSFVGIGVFFCVIAWCFGIAGIVRQKNESPQLS